MSVVLSVIVYCFVASSAYLTVRDSDLRVIYFKLIEKIVKRLGMDKKIFMGRYVSIC